MRSSTPLLLAIVLLFAGCDRATPSSDSDAEWERRTRAQRDAYDRQVRRADEQQDKADEQDRRFDDLLEKWEEQARRYDAILDAMEKQQGLKK